VIEAHQIPLLEYIAAASAVVSAFCAVITLLLALRREKATMSAVLVFAKPRGNPNCCRCSARRRYRRGR
jgi:hypothetical protein